MLLDSWKRPPGLLSGAEGALCQCLLNLTGFYGQSPEWLGGKVSTYNAGDTGDVSSIPGSGRSPGIGNGNPLQYSCLEKLHGQRSLEGYSP